MSTPHNQKKEEILSAARQLFAKYGLDKTTIMDIARQVRMGKASIYYYFKNKEALFKEVIHSEGQQIQKEIIKAVNSARSVQQKLLLFVVARMRRLKQIITYYGGSPEDYFQNYTLIEEARHDFEHFEYTMVLNLLEEGTTQGVFEIENTDLVAEAIVAGIKGFEYHWLFETPLKKIERNASVLLNVIMQGIEKKG